MLTRDVRKIADYIYSPYFDLDSFVSDKLHHNPAENSYDGKRPLSESFEGAGFGDEGKGSVVAREITRLLKKYDKVIVYRWNGGSNSGHEWLLSDGMIALHQFPMGILYEKTTSIVGRGMVFNPWDAVSELKEAKSRLRVIPGKIFIDPNVTLSLDTHRAWERIINNWHLGYSGSTGRGISISYADDILRLKLTLADLISPNWQGKFGYHYEMVKKLLGAFGFSLEETKISTLDNPKKGLVVGKRKDFLDRLGFCREILRSYIDSDLFNFLFREWNLGATPFVFEGGQAIGLHPKHGVYPDVTSSETRARGIQDSTEGIVDYRKIAGRYGVLKGPYISSVGSRVLPGEFELTTAVSLRENFGEYGATTGRPRGILPPDIPALSYLRNVSDYEYLVVTHMDTTLAKIPVVVKYRDKNGIEIGFRPYQWQLDKVVPEVIELPGWEGKYSQAANKPEELPENAIRFLAFLSSALDIKIVWATNGPELKNIISWLPS